jgi:predicted type IV restriction endonuclease
MPNTPTRVANRLASGLKEFQPILESAKARDVNESDTVIIITDMLSEMFGYDKYSELTSEVSVRGTYCDLATTVDGEVQFLVEVKAIGSELKDSHTRQAVDYAANTGVEWVVLTNGAIWKIYKVNFGKPIDPELVIEFDLLSLDAKSDEHIDSLFLLSKEGFRKSALGEYEAQREALSRFCIAALILSDPVLNVVRKELRRMSPDVRIDIEQVKAVLKRDVIKRDAIEGDKAAEAHRRVARAIAKAAKAKTAGTLEEAPAQPETALPIQSAETSLETNTKTAAAKV